MGGLTWALVPAASALAASALAAGCTSVKVGVRAGGDSGGDTAGTDSGADTASLDADTGETADSADTGETADTSETAETADTGPDPLSVLCINEFMASNLFTTSDEDGYPSDWIELYNPGDVALTLTGMTMTDDLDEPDKHTLGDGLEISAGGFIMFWADGLSEEGSLHLGFSLDDSGEDIGLYLPNGHAVDLVTYDSLPTDVSAARTPDGSLTWVLTDLPTPGGSNGTGE